MMGEPSGNGQARAIEALRAAVRDQDLDEVDAKALEHIARDAYGLEENAAATFVASITGHPIEACMQAVARLTARDLLLLVQYEGGARLVANFEKLGLDESIRQNLLARAFPYDLLEAPHSPQAMATLHSLFDEEVETLYLGIEVTDPAVFARLTSRARIGRKTVILMPRKENVRPDRRLHYDEILQRWVQLLKRDKQHHKNTRLRITKRAYPQIYTGALSRNHARIDLYSYTMGSTREGSMLQVPRGNSLYSLIQGQFAEAFHRSRSLFRVWPVSWMTEVLGEYVLGVGLAVAVIALSLTQNTVANVAAGLLLGVGSNAAWDYVRRKTWGVPALFESE